MKQFWTKPICALLALLMIFALAGCNAAPKAVTVIDTYQSAGRLKVLKGTDTMDYFVMESYSIQLLSDNTYICAINISEPYQSLKNDFEYDTVNILKDIAVSTVTRFGTYEISIDEELGTFTLKLGQADRVIYSTNAGGGHYPIVPSNNLKYIDSADETTTADCSIEWYGTWDDFMAKVGAEVTLTGDAASHICDAGQMIFEYRTPMYYTLDGSEIW